MNWQAIAAISEIIGTIAVVVSLIYVAVQIRQNTAALNTDARASFLAALQTVNSFSLANSDVVHRGLFNGEELDGEDLTRFTTIVHSAFNAWEALYTEFLAGNVEPEYWEGKLRQIQWTLSRPSCRHAWDNFTHLFDERFVKYIERNIGPHDGTKR